MSVRTIIGVGLIVAGTIAVVAVLVDALDGSNETATLPAEGLVTQLSEDQEERALELVEGDPRLKDLIGDRRYEPEEVAPWATVDGQRLVGAILKLELQEPVTVGPANWPIMIAAATASPVRAKKPYITRTARLAVKNATEIMASVDLRKSMVVGLMPGGPNFEARPIKFYGSPPGPAFREPEGY
jgi:hypothetical protein